MTKGSLLHNFDSSHTAAESVYQSLYERILDGEIAPRTRLTEVDLTLQYGVSRTPVREALTRLVSAGVAERQTGGGVVASTQPLEAVLDALLIFELLEGLAARLAVERAGPAGIAALRQSLQKLAGKLSTHDTEGFIAKAIEFNQTMWKLADSDQLYSMISVVGVSAQRIRHSTLRDSNRANEAMEQLTTLTDAIENRDAELAESTARSVIRRSRQMRLDEGSRPWSSKEEAPAKIPDVAH